MSDRMREKFVDKSEEIIRQGETEDDVIMNLTLRPKLLDDFVGQKGVIEPLIIALQAAKKRNEPMEHVLFSGPPGLGKTSLAHIIANEVGTKVTATSGPAIDRAGDFIGILTNMSEGDILFIDEIHRLSKTVEEFIYPAMENFQIDFLVDKGPYAKTIKFNLKRFTLRRYYAGGIINRSAKGQIRHVLSSRILFSRGTGNNNKTVRGTSWNSH